ncbi:integration host factor subunit beta [bacterium]|nr:integration host factor subunit beta [bacterium]
MTKNDIVELVARELNVTNVQGKIIVNIIVNELQKSLVKGKRIQIRGLGSFIVKKREKMNRRHPGTGKIITIPKQKVVRFIPGKNLKNIK